MFVPVFLTGSLRVFSGLLGCNHFRGAAVNYSSLLLEDGPGLLYVGAREAIYKLDTANISDTNISFSVGSVSVTLSFYMFHANPNSCCPYLYNSWTGQHLLNRRGSA